MKIISFVVPCYNSEAYMKQCVDALLKAGHDVEIIIVNDGSSDCTGAIADDYLFHYPHRVRVIHQSKKGYGSSVNTGLKSAKGVYFKIVDPQDFIEERSLIKLLAKLKDQYRRGILLDLIVTNYLDVKKKRRSFRGSFPTNKVFSWQDVKRYRTFHFMFLQGLTFSTHILKDKSFLLQEDLPFTKELLACQSLHLMKHIYYMDIDLYHQRVNQKQDFHEDQILAAYLLVLNAHLVEAKLISTKLYFYLIKHLSFVIHSTTQMLGENKAMLWQFIKTYDLNVYRHLRWHPISLITAFYIKLSERH